MNKQAHDALTRARTAMIMDAPFFGVLSTMLHLVETPEIPTLATDGESIFYNPAFVLALDKQYHKSAIAHEVVHCVLDHCNRGGGRDKLKWNHAIDYVDNELLQSSGFPLHPNWLRNTKYDGMSADHVYTLLPDTLSGEALCEVRPQPGMGKDGQQPTNGMKPAIDWQIATIQAAQAARQQGKLPASLERFIEQVAGGKVDWRAVLWRFADEIVKADYSWAHPNRRFIPYDLVLPSLHSKGMGTLVIFVDTSGSIDDVILAAFAAEITAMREAVSPRETYVIGVDAEVQSVDHFEVDDEFYCRPKGGGGTDFRPAFDYIERHQIQPTAAIYLTDMYGTFPQTSPEYPVLWCATTDVIAPWGETVRVQI